jgi:hypothetical protein
MAGRTSKTRTQDCSRQDALSRLQQAESFVDVADMVITGGETEFATPGVAAALAVLAGIAASDAACCAKLRVRPRGLTGSRRLVDSPPHGGASRA